MTSRDPEPRSDHAAIVVRSGICIAEHIEIARGPLARLRGLLGRRTMKPQSGLLLDPCKGIHTVGMRFSIDALFLDRSGHVKRVEHRLPPGRFIPFVRGASQVIELPPGTLEAAEIQAGDEVWLVAPGRLL